MARRAALAALAALVVAACSADHDELVAVFPADYAASYVRVRDCRASADHDLGRVVVLADPSAATAYRERDRPFPVGAVILKEEYDASDETCSGPIAQWTAMQRLASGARPAALDWRWQKVDARGQVVSEDEPRCYGCHTTCGAPPDGYLATCSVP